MEDPGFVEKPGFLYSGAILLPDLPAFGFDQRRRQVYCKEIPIVPDPNELQRNYREFLDLLPLTLALAGLPQSDIGKYFTEEQIEARSFTIKHAYKAARSVARECIQR
jgi:hypothetical protein